MEHRSKSQQQQLFELKQQLTNDTAELKLRLAQAKGSVQDADCHILLNCCTSAEILSLSPLSDRLEMEKQRSKQALEDMNCLRRKEVQNNGRSFWNTLNQCRFENIFKKCCAQMDHATHIQEESERALNERILKLEGRRIQLEEV